MSIRNKAIEWLKKNFPSEKNNITRTSKFYSESELWFFTLPSSFFDMKENSFLNILCEHEKGKNSFHFFKIPFSYIKNNKNIFDIRKNGESFDLHISAKRTEKFIEKRSQGKVNFSGFKQ